MDKVIIPVVAACIVDKYPSLRILLHIKDESPNPELIGKWEFPGGKIEYGESPEGALQREIGEELGGIIVQIGQLIYAQTNIYQNGRHYLVLFYECRTGYKAEPDGCKYFYPDQIMELNCLPGTREVVRKLVQ